MNIYLAYRSALLDVDCGSSFVLKTLNPDFKEKFKSELDLKLFLLALRVKDRLQYSRLKQPKPSGRI